MRPVLMLLVFALIVAAAASHGSSGERPLTSGVYVSVEEQADLHQTASGLVDRGNGRVAVAELLTDLHGLRMTVPAGDAVALGAIRSAPGVRFVEPVSSMDLADSPVEPYFSYQSAYLQTVNAQRAWDIEKGRPEVVVAVIDTGIDVVHPDLQANIWFNAREVANNGADDDANGCVDDVNGCAFVTSATPGCTNITNGFIRDDIGHGTFVAGIIAAPVNGAGIAGIARGVRVMAVKVLDCNGASDSVAVARGILYAARNGARVINVSLGGLFEAAVVNEAVATAMSQHGAVIVAAGGNSGNSSVAFPARIPSVLSVGATKAAGDARAEFSSYGPAIDVVAVGERIYSTVPAARCNLILPCLAGGPYGYGDGTSFTAPQVAGLAALMISLRPSLSAEQVIGIIRSTATPLAPGRTPGWAGAGRVNMFAALQNVQSGLPAGEPCTVAAVEDGDTFSCTNGKRVRMLQVDAPNLGQCGGDWARAALGNIFLIPGRTVYLQYDSRRTDAEGRLLAVPIWRGNDGNDYNLSIVLLYVGLARAAEIGAGNVMFLDWGLASESWARALSWNMWAPGKPFVGGC